MSTKLLWRKNHDTGRVEAISVYDNVDQEWLNQEIANFKKLDENSGITSSFFCSDIDLVKGSTEEVGDTVNHPQHYNRHPSGVECIQVVRWFNFNLGNAIKYIWRAGYKPGATKVQDLKKAIWYLQDELEREADGTALGYGKDGRVA